jgi:hypothetical protein
MGKSWAGNFVANGLTICGRLPAAVAQCYTAAAFKCLAEVLGKPLRIDQCVIKIMAIELNWPAARCAFQCFEQILLLAYLKYLLLLLSLSIVVYWMPLLWELGLVGVIGGAIWIFAWPKPDTSSDGYLD